MSLACIRGCTVRKQHLTDCYSPDCRGCLPALVDEPHVVCWRDYTNTAQAITQAPDVIAHILSVLEPGAAPEKGAEQHTKGDSPPAPMNIQAAADADTLHAELASWVLLIMEERGVNGPDWQGSDIRPATKRRTDWGETVYEPPRLVGVRDPDATASIATWLNIHLDWAMRQEWAGEMVTLITRTVNSAKARWPVEEPPRFLPIRCPSCGLRSLRRHAPSTYRAEPVIDCRNPNCQKELPVDHPARESA